MKISYKSVKGSSVKNEDYLVINEENNIYAVLDGASSLGQLDGSIASNTVAKCLLENNNNSLYERVKKGNDNLCEIIKDYMGVDNLNILNKHDLSTTGLIGVEIKNNRLFYIHSGDCLLVLKLKNEEIRVVSYDMLSKLDLSVLKKGEKLRETLPENTNIRELINDDLVFNRNLLNTETGYSVIDGSEEALSLIEEGNLSLNFVEQILLISDGLILSRDLEYVNHENTIREFAKIAFNNGLDRLFDVVDDYESIDKELLLYPRFKYSDDKTGILIDLRN